MQSGPSPRVARPGTLGLLVLPVQAVLLRSRKGALVSLGSAVAIVLVTGFVVAERQSERTETLVRDAEELSQRSDDLIVPAAGSYGLTVEYRLPGVEEPHARLETELTLEEGRNTLDVTLDTNDSRDYQGFWDPARSEGSVVAVLNRKLSSAELYGNGLDAVTRSAERLFGRTAEDLRPTSRAVELLRERIEL